MREQDINPIDGVQLLRSYLLHCRKVQQCLHSVTRELDARAERHDDSKLMSDEFAGFSRINKMAREYPYGSEEYKAGLKMEAGTIEKHYSRNSHHPEARTSPQTMGWLDLIEMVCDWRGAYLAYGSQGTWEDNTISLAKRYEKSFSSEQWWLIHQLLSFVEVVK